MKKTLLILLVPVLFSGCNRTQTPPAATAEDARKFLADAEEKLMALSVEDQHAQWVHENFITDDTDALASKADQRAIDASVQLAKDATRFDKVQLPEDMARKMKLLHLAAAAHIVHQVVGVFFASNKSHRLSPGRSI